MNENKNLIDIKQNPLDLFDKWFGEAKLKEIEDPHAMNLATVSNDLQPTSRIVLLKSFNVNGFVFYTNLNSKKGEAIKNNSQVALNFFWKSIQKQVCIEGKAKIIDEKEADKYFDSRPKDSRISAWASKQSSELKNREGKYVLNSCYFEQDDTFKNINGRFQLVYSRKLPKGSWIRKTRNYYIKYNLLFGELKNNKGKYKYQVIEIKNFKNITVNNGEFFYL